MLSKFLNPLELKIYNEEEAGYYASLIRKKAQTE